jgi:hypothetical protein
MNTLERRRLVRDRIIDGAIAKAAVHESTRQRAQAATELRKALAARQSAAISPETISYPRQALG